MLTSLVSAICVFFSVVKEDEKAKISNLQYNAESIFQHASQFLSDELFNEVNSYEDAEKTIFKDAQRRLNITRRISNMRYLYTIKRNAEGKPVYHIDGLLSDSEDYCSPGAPVDRTILDDVNKALNGQIVLADRIKKTDHGYIYASYWPYKDKNGQVVGALGLEYDATLLVTLGGKTMLRSVIGLVIIIVVLNIIFSFLFKGITRPFHKHIAYTDVLTGINNRTAFELDKRRINRALLAYSNISMIMFDLNNLKQVNDTLGHHKGDTYIIMAGQLIEKHFGPFGITYRIGGDEFCVVSVDNDEEKLLSILEQDFSNDLFKHREIIKINGQGFFSIAYGIASFDKRINKDIHEVFIAADERMYTKKREMKKASYSSMSTPSDPEQFHKQSDTVTL